MEQFLSLIGMQAVKLAVRSGIVFTSTYALKQYSHLLTTVEDAKLSDELKALKTDLDRKIKIITPAINLIELRSGQGNSALESASSLTDLIQKDIMSLGHKITSLASLQPDQAAICRLITDIRRLIAQITESIPLLQLAISASGESLSTGLPDSVSPSRMLQASAFLMIADSKFTANPQTTIQVGPEFIVSVFMVFRGYSYEPLKQSDDCRSSQGPHAHKIRKPSWQEVLHKARLSLHRQPMSGTRKQNDRILDSSEYSYYLEIKEEKDDGRLHDDDESAEKSSTGDHILITEITKLLYTNSAAILNIKDDLEAYSTPILLLKRRKREIHRCNSPEDASKPEFSSSDNGQHRIDRQILDDSHNERIRARNNISRYSRSHKSQFPSYLDPEWIAFEMYTSEASDEPKWGQCEAESEASDTEDSESSANRVEEIDNAAKQFSSLKIGNESVCPGKKRLNGPDLPAHFSGTEVVNGASSNLVNMVTTSLSLLELVLRLAIAQETQQMSHLSIPDHILTSFLNEKAQPSNTGNGA